jgi:hypothetical protein
MIAGTVSVRPGWLIARGHDQARYGTGLTSDLANVPSKESQMVYTVGFGKRNKPGVSTVRTNTAQEAIELAEALTRSDEEIQFIDTPTDGRVGIDMLCVLAKEEAGEA